MGYTPLPSHSELSSKQKKLIDELRSCVSKTGINLDINPKIWQQCHSQVSVDVEHNELGIMVGIGLCWNSSCYYFTEITPYLKSVLETTELIMHNGVSDIECLRMWGINVRDEQLVWDSMLLGHIIDSSQKDYSLKSMAKRELQIEYPSYDDIVGKRGLKAERITLDRQPLELVSLYNSMDTYCTYQLYLKQKKAMGL